MKNKSNSLYKLNLCAIRKSVLWGIIYRRRNDFLTHDITNICAIHLFFYSKLRGTSNKPIELTCFDCEMSFVNQFALNLISSRKMFAIFYETAPRKKSDLIRLRIRIGRVNLRYYTYFLQAQMCNNSTIDIFMLNIRLVCVILWVFHPLKLRIIFLQVRLL